MQTSEISCVTCDRPFSVAQPSSEHVIPNALGGRLKTSRATCISCNSRVGHQRDARLVEQFQLLANALDVIRDRGEHPDARFIDSETMLDYRLHAGKSPMLTPNISVERSGSSIKFRFSASTKKEAEEILRRARPHRPHVLGPLIGTPQPASKFTANLLRYSADDEQILRAVARIAVCFARHAGVPVDRTDSTLRFARGEQLDRRPVAPVCTDVVAVPGLSEPPLYHALFLNKAVGNAPLLVYVALFQVCEFLVEFSGDYGSAPISSVHLLNLVSGLPEERPFEWLLTNEQASTWFNTPRLDHARVMSRIAPLQYYLGQRELLWIDRALLLGATRYFRATDRGATKEDAKVEALAEANRVLARYDMQIDTLNIV